MLDLPDELMLLLTTKANEALIHVDFLGALQPERLAKRIKNTAWTHAVGFRPTGETIICIVTILVTMLQLQVYNGPSCLTLCSKCRDGDKLMNLEVTHFGLYLMAEIYFFLSGSFGACCLIVFSYNWVIWFIINITNVAAFIWTPFLSWQHKPILDKADRV